MGPRSLAGQLFAATSYPTVAAVWKISSLAPLVTAVIAEEGEMSEMKSRLRTDNGKYAVRLPTRA
jgi:hypothetical protein